MTSPFRQLHHICLVVHDIDAAIAYYEGIGIGPWQDYPPLSQFADLDVPNPEAFSHMKYRYVDLESVQIQLCEPPKLDCPQRRFLHTRGEGVFHIGFEADLDTAISQAQESGLDLIMSGRRDNGTGFAYFDTLDQAGVVWNGIDGAILDILWPVHNGVLRFTSSGDATSATPRTNQPRRWQMTAPIRESPVSAGTRASHPS